VYLGFYLEKNKSKVAFLRFLNTLFLTYYFFNIANMASILLNIQIVVCILLIIVVLLQNKNVSLNLTSMGG
jgi:uncharacterized membrane protein